MKRVAVLGATGSIGRQALDVIEANPGLELAAAASGSQPIDGLAPLTQVGGDPTALLERADPDVVLNAIVGFAGVTATLWVLERGIDLALANKESLVVGGELVTALAEATGADLRLLHVVPVFRGRNEEWTLGPQDESPPELEPSVKAVSSLGVEPVREMAMGRPERTLVRVAERDEVDLVVVGHRGVSGITRRLLGSVSEHVAHHAGADAAGPGDRGPAADAGFRP
jgi:1-deoxy-D-xylulose 5-phosphate reductoisomerase